MYMHSKGHVWPFLLKREARGQVERAGPEEMLRDRCLESLRRVVGWGESFLLVDVLLEYSHLTQHFDLDISEMLNRLE